MSFSDIIYLIDQLMTSTWAPLLLFGVILIIALVKIKRKNNKISLLKKDDRFMDANFFPLHIKTPMAISPNGYLGFVTPQSPIPLVMNIKNIKGVV